MEAVPSVEAGEDAVLTQAPCPPTSDDESIPEGSVLNSPDIYAE